MTSGPHSQFQNSLIRPMLATMVAPVPGTLPDDQPRQPLRLRLKPKASATGYVDGGWWPRSRDLAAELPALVEVLSVRLGHVTRVAYAMSAWNPPPRRITVDGAVVRLEGFRSQDGHLLYLIAPDRERINLLVVPPDAPAAAGHQAMMVAARRSNSDSPGEILAAAGATADVSVPAPRHARAAAQKRWGTDD
jgi:hypothetical protein